VTPGVETTTGPLGQGLANAVGMALAERLLAAEFNRTGHAIVDHRTYAFVGDGCLMEGISHEACSLAGTLGLAKLTVLYDDNGISIDGNVREWFGDDTPARFEAYGWHVARAVDGHDVDAVDAAIEAAHRAGRPTLICCRTTIGKGAPTRQGRAKAHGEPLGEAEIDAARAALGWHHPPFAIPGGIYDSWDATRRGARASADWRRRLDAYRAAFPAQAAELLRRTAAELPANWTQRSASWLDELARTESAPIATRKASQNALARIAEALPELLGGSADLTGSNLTDWKGATAVRAKALAVGQVGRHINYGVREFAMAAIANGIALHRGYLPFCGTFVTFSDYSRNAIRLAALMRLRVIHVLTHDSIGLGEDGPTHQPIEHAGSLRLIPNLDVWRPCGALETTVSWQHALERADGPSALLLSRQALPPPPAGAAPAQIRRGAYVLAEIAESHAVIVATGSEVALALEAQRRLAADGIACRVVSMPSTSVFDRQDAEYREQILPRHLPVVSVEAGSTAPWGKYTGRDGRAVGIDVYGESAPAPALYEHFGLTAAAVENAVRSVLGVTSP
jgi:transketolase